MVKNYVYVFTFLLIFFTSLTSWFILSYTNNSEVTKQRGMISGAIKSKDKKDIVEGGVKTGNEFKRVSDDPVIANLTGGFAGFG